MKPLLAICVLLLTHVCFSQSLDYISVRKKNGRVIKNFYAGSDVVIQTTNGAFLQGPVSSVRNDSVFVTVYDIRYSPTAIGTFYKDTVSISIAGLHKRDISRILIDKKRSFWERTAGPLAMIAGAGYLTLNLLNGAFFDFPITDKSNLKKLGISAGLFGSGFLFGKLFSSDGFTKKKHQIIYVDL